MDGYLDHTSNHSGGHGSNVGGCHEQGLHCNMATQAAFLSNFSATIGNRCDGLKADSQEVEADIINSHGSLEQQGVLLENEFIAAVDCANQNDLRDEETLNCSVFTAEVGRRGRGSQNLEDPLLGSNEETQKKLSVAVKTSNNSSTSTKAVSSEKVKTELELEMELFEAAEREDKMRLISSSRLEEQGDSTIPKGGVPVIQGLKNERKRGLDDTAADVSQVLPRKRGRRAHRVSPTMEEDDVCFVCFDGGELVLCDRRSCPKAYHLSCIGRDAAFFKKKGSWFCGWHFCCGCCRPANLQCYTCPKAYCIGCSKEADFLTVRKRKGLCDDCLPIVKMIESSGTENADGVNVDFDDPDTYECLFKEYWKDLKSKFSLRLPNIRRDGKTLANTGELVEEDNFDMDELSETEMSSGESDEEVEMFDVKEAGGDKNNESESVASRLVDEEQVDGWPMESHETNDVDALGKDTERLLPHEFDGWASKGLLEFLVFMNCDPKISISRFQVNKLLWSYIKSNKLQNRRKRTIIECDERLQKLFGKKSMHQYEMMKDIHLHFPPKGSSAKSTASRRRASNARVVEKDLQRDVQPTVNGIQERSDTNSYKDTPKSKREDEASEVSKVDSNEYAAIIPQNISLIYLRRTLLEDLLDDPEFETKVIGTFVRIRVPGTSGKPEMCYRLAQVAGIKVQSQKYKTGKKTTNVVLEIMNLHKKEDLTIDLVSNQDFTVEECHRLCQSVKCHFIRALRVGEIEQKALSIREAKLNDWFETEVLRLIALRDGANEKGRKKELRECIEKLQKFSDADFRAKELRSLPVVIADPHMNPDYESDGNEEELNNDRGGLFKFTQGSNVIKAVCCAKFLHSCCFSQMCRRAIHEQRKMVGARRCGNN
ncbi:hypothetical protein O6H91_20G065700 [Diphasiastrum complanatum]|uniref:Uncharacterized protein n=1 Tax=Diphasiastrum complanatum TaxID=34168 RepID=A0ACC2ARI3_DIPCM|nr:hypothetical protein O6H91_20G065700 [Diphasiastrum complanatum]